jgi:hypothetical protein
VKKMTKTELLEILVKELRFIDGGRSSLDTKYGQAQLGHDAYQFTHNVHENVYPRYIFLEEVNDFPIICLHALEETRTHIGGGVKYGNILINLRGYVYDEDEDDVNASAEALIDDIDHVISLLPARHPCFVELRVLDISTDEGLMEPHGVLEMNLLATYLVESE